MQIRPATKADLSDVMNLVRRVVPLMRESGNFQWDDQYPNRAVFEQDIEKWQLWLADVEGQVAGIAAITTDQEPEYAEVGWDISESAVVVHRLGSRLSWEGRSNGTHATGRSGGEGTEHPRLAR
jgi:ribosomal protein S18 acetylase RimI-like enzyme